MVLPIPSRVLQNLIFWSVLLLVSFPVLARLWFDYLIGGDGWRQGDWLINFGAGPVRRGAIGEAIIVLSDMSGAPLLALTIGLQISLFLLFIMLFLLIWHRHTDRALILFLIASPAFFLIQWAGEVQGIMRKELLGYLAMGVLTLASISTRSHPIFVFLALMLFALACFGNILNALLVIPFCWALYFLQVQGRLADRTFFGLSALAGSLALGSILFAVRFKDIPELAGICNPLISRGLDPSFCNLALSWMVTDKVDHAVEVGQRVNPENLVQFAAVALLAIVPIVILFRLIRETGHLALIVATTFLPMLPLYILATDWGRWLSIPYSFLVFVVLIGHHAGKLTFRRELSPTAIYMMLVLSLLISHDVSIGWDVGGTVASFVRTAEDFL